MSAGLAVGLALAAVGLLALAGLCWEWCSAVRRRLADRRAARAALADPGCDNGGRNPEPMPRLAADPLDEPIPVDYVVLDDAFVAGEFGDIVARLDDVAAAARRITHPQPPIIPGRDDR